MTRRPVLTLVAAFLLCAGLFTAGHQAPVPARGAALGPTPARSPRAPGAAALDVSLMGQWSDSIPWPVVAISAHVLPNGKVLAWGTPRARNAKGVVWDPIGGTFTDASLETANIFCSGHAFLPDGRLFVAGGHIGTQVGRADAHLYDPATNTWTPTAPMNGGRWYPTSTTLPSGEVLVVSGAMDRGVRNTLPQVWQPDGVWRDLTAAVLNVPLYPWMHVAPNGSVFNSGPDRMTRYLNTAGTGSWTDVGSLLLRREQGTSVMYDDGKVLAIGGGGPPSNTAEVIDLNAPAPAWRFTNPMSVGRRHHNATLLPDGKVLVTGGSSGPGFNNAGAAVFSADAWDPETEQWTTWASAQVRRLYHSTAFLLPDGRVVSGGGGGPPGTGGTPPDANHLNVEIFSPPYLFTPDGLPAVRPLIVSAPDSVGYAETFFVETPAATAISKVTWIRLSSVTHRFNMNQRINRLGFALSSDGLDVTAPANANLCPPGHYMLFLVDANGVPSVARIVRIA